MFCSVLSKSANIINGKYLNVEEIKPEMVHLTSNIVTLLTRFSKGKYLSSAVEGTKTSTVWPDFVRNLTDV
jgi:hypothetical protein